VLRGRDDTSESHPTFDTIVALAQAIARTVPERAGKVLQIVDLVRGMGPEPDQETVRDALIGQTGGGDVSAVSTQRAASEMLKAV
jgi:hypothetical protein